MHTDWDKLACLLCKRAFPSKEKLNKHNQVSDLHRQNLEEYRRQRGGGGGGGDPVGQSDSSLQQQQQQDQQVYRDRAKERRLKYGEDDEMQKRAAKNKVSPLQVFFLLDISGNVLLLKRFSLELRIFHLN